MIDPNMAVYIMAAQKYPHCCYVFFGIRRGYYYNVMVTKYVGELIAQREAVSISGVIDDEVKIRAMMLFGVRNES